MSAVSRSHLYVPADQPRMLERAFDRQADAIIVDLEDSVSAAAKPEARRELSRWLEHFEGRPDVEVWVRVNLGDGPSPPYADIAAAVHPAVTGIVQAKCSDPAYLIHLDDALAHAENRTGTPVGSTRVSVLIESPPALLDLRVLARGPRVVRLQLGEADLVASLGMDPDPDGSELLPIRLAVVVTSAAEGLTPPVAPVDRNLADQDAIRRSSEALRCLGFGGRAAIHPMQVPIINDVFTPSPEEEASARSLLDRFDSAARQHKGVVVDEQGRMVDAAVVRAARTIVERAAFARNRASNK